MISAVVAVTPSRMFSSDVVAVTPSSRFSSLTSSVAPSRMFSSAGVDVILTPPTCSVVALTSPLAP